MAIKPNKEITYKQLYKYIKGIEGAIKYLNIAVLAGGQSIKYFERYYDELDEKERELVYIKKLMARTTVFEKCYAVGFNAERMAELKKELKTIKVKFDYELAEDTYFLANHIMNYEEKCKDE